MAIIAAMKNVLSPSSETIITDIEAANAWMKPKLPIVDCVVLIDSDLSIF